MYTLKRNMEICVGSFPAEYDFMVYKIMDISMCSSELESENYIQKAVKDSSDSFKDLLI